MVICFCRTIFLKRNEYVEILCMYHVESHVLLLITDHFIHFNTRHVSIERQHVELCQGQKFGDVRQFHYIHYNTTKPVSIKRQHIAVNGSGLLSYYQVIKNPVTDHLPTGCKKIGKSLLLLFSLSNIKVLMISE